MEHFIQWLDDPTVKGILLWIGGFILKKWPAFENKVIPLVLMGVSALTTIIHTAFPGGGEAASTATVAVVHSPLVNVLLPVAAAVATHSTGKNLWQLVKRLF